eukprot:GHVQ01016575.1.p1 GENE.GHVQ01016575.1~~GHVQ01016575.1.p1  ORF type:complete len:409 (+),score=55.65 GHVQ01016575.1:61-1227(+)
MLSSFQRQRGRRGRCVSLVLLLITSAVGSVVATPGQFSRGVARQNAAIGRRLPPTQNDAMVQTLPTPPLEWVTVPTAVQQLAEYDKIVTNLKEMDSDAFCKTYKDWPLADPGKAICDVFKDCPPATAGQVNTGNTEAVADLSDKPEWSEQQLITCLIALGNLHPSEKTKLEGERTPTKKKLSEFRRTVKNLRVPKAQKHALFGTALCPMNSAPAQFVYHVTQQRRVAKCAQLVKSALINGPVSCQSLGFESIDRIFDSLVEEYSTKHGWHDAAQFLNSNPYVTSTSREEPFRRVCHKLDDATYNVVLSNCLVRILIGGSRPVFALPGDEGLSEDVQRDKRNIRIFQTFRVTTAEVVRACLEDGLDKAVMERVVMTLACTAITLFGLYA